MIESTTRADIQDYVAIKKYVPEATSKQVKWIKELLDMARSLGVYEPVGENIMSLCKDFEPEYSVLKLQLLRNIKSAFAMRLQQKTKPTPHEELGQLGLFHPEAFDGGDNQTLRQM